MNVCLGRAFKVTKGYQSLQKWSVSLSCQTDHIHKTPSLAQGCSLDADWSAHTAQPLIGPHNYVLTRCMRPSGPHTSCRTIVRPGEEDDCPKTRDLCAARGSSSSRSCLGGRSSGRAARTNPITESRARAGHSCYASSPPPRGRPRLARLQDGSPKRGGQGRPAQDRPATGPCRPLQDEDPADETLPPPGRGDKLKRPHSTC